MTFAVTASPMEASHGNPIGDIKTIRRNHIWKRMRGVRVDTLGLISYFQDGLCDETDTMTSFDEVSINC